MTKASNNDIQHAQIPVASHLQTFLFTLVEDHGMLNVYAHKFNRMIIHSQPTHNTEVTFGLSLNYISDLLFQLQLHYYINN